LLLVDSSKPRIFLAPMEGVVDYPLRRIYSQVGGYDIFVTEFIRVLQEPVTEREIFKYAPEMREGYSTAEGIPVLVQFLGSHPEALAESALVAADSGCVGIDLNFGCPAKTVNRHDGGATLLKDPMRIRTVVETVRKALPPKYSVSAKVRLGFDSKDHAMEIAKAAEDGGASWLTVHARTKIQMYQPPVDWPLLGRMAQSVKIPVVANGDIWTAQDAELCRQTTGCQHLMVGRGAFADPWLAERIRGIRRSDFNFDTKELLALVERFAAVSLEHGPERYVVKRVKQWIKHLGRNFTHFALNFDTIKTLDTVEGILERMAQDNALLYEARQDSTPARVKVYGALNEGVVFVS